MVSVPDFSGLDDKHLELIQTQFLKTTELGLEAENLQDYYKARWGSEAAKVLNAVNLKSLCRQASELCSSSRIYAGLTRIRLYKDDKEAIELKKKSPYFDEKLAVPDLSQQSRLIEILQALIHTKGKGIKKPIPIPRLFLVLTCWDELNTENTPEEVMKEKLPLMHDLIVTNWQEGRFTFLGLSAQGFPLDTPEAKDKYLDELPENFGYVVLENGKQDKDLTKLIELAIAQ